MEELMRFHLDEEHRGYYNKELMIYTMNTDNPQLHREAVWDNCLGLSKLIDLLHCCSVCQGMLQVVDSEPVVKHICDKAITESFEFDSFKFNVHSPLSTNFRYDVCEEAVPPDSGRAREDRERHRHGRCSQERADCTVEGAHR